MWSKRGNSLMQQMNAAWVKNNSVSALLQNFPTMLNTTFKSSSSELVAYFVSFDKEYFVLQSSEQVILLTPLEYYLGTLCGTYKMNANFMCLWSLGFPNHKMELNLHLQSHSESKFVNVCEVHTNGSKDSIWLPEPFLTQSQNLVWEVLLRLLLDQDKCSGLVSVCLTNWGVNISSSVPEWDRPTANAVSLVYKPPFWSFLTFCACCDPLLSF